MTVTGDPVVLNEVGTHALDAAQDVQTTARQLDERVFVSHDQSGPGHPDARVGDLAPPPGQAVQRAYPDVVAAAQEGLRALAGVLESDGYHLQRSSRELDEAANGPGLLPTEAPGGPSDGPPAETEAPGGPSDGPPAETEAPGGSAEGPPADTEAPGGPTEQEPPADTEAPGGPTEQEPPADTEAPGGPTEQEPPADTEAPGAPSEPVPPADGQVPGDAGAPEPPTAPGDGAPSDGTPPVDAAETDLPSPGPDLPDELPIQEAVAAPPPPSGGGSSLPDYLPPVPEELPPAEVELPTGGPINPDTYDTGTAVGTGGKISRIEGV